MNTSVNRPRRLVHSLMLRDPQHQNMFTARDAGHGAITHNFTFDTIIGLVIADFCCGLSMG
ncbi:fatty acid desaturase [Colletotrichum higginsianum]|nr:fatty acid desaturase [Colletotrichum higginsianum]